jgi:hypothetical protein
VRRCTTGAHFRPCPKGLAYRSSVSLAKKAAAIFRISRSIRSAVLVNRRGEGQLSSMSRDGAREYLGGSDASTSRFTLRRLIPSRRAISLFETPSADIA